MKRHYYKIETPVSIALKRMRESTGISLKKLETRMEVSASVIGHTENGRKDTISQEYIQKITEALGYSLEDWESFLHSRSNTYLLRQECKSILEKIQPSKLEMIKSVLENFNN